MLDLLSYRSVNGVLVDLAPLFVRQDSVSDGQHLESGMLCASLQHYQHLIVDQIEN